MNIDINLNDQQYDFHDDRPVDTSDLTTIASTLAPVDPACVGEVSDSTAVVPSNGGKPGTMAIPSRLPWLDPATDPDPEHIIERIWTRNGDDRSNTIENAIDVAYLIKIKEKVKDIAERLAYNETRVRNYDKIGTSPLILQDLRKDLPSCWTILFHLAFLSESFLRTCIADGRVHPRMSHDEAKALRPPVAKRTTKKKKPELLPPFKPHRLDMAAINNSEEAKELLAELIALGGAIPLDETSDGKGERA
jgi:hypothetical protein